MRVEIPIATTLKISFLRLAAGLSSMMTALL
jgi:hypothetical protein